MKSSVLHSMGSHRFGDDLATDLVKNLPAMQESQVHSLTWEDPLEKEIITHSSVLAGEFHGQWSLTGDSPWGLKKSQTRLSN